MAPWRHDPVPTLPIPGRLSASIVRRMRGMALVAVDVDGVLTDGRMPYLELSGRWANGREFCVADGLALTDAERQGITCVVITAKTGPAVQRRCQDMGVSRLITGREDKGAAFLEELSAQRVAPEHAAYIGDDLPDLSALAVAGLAVAPSSAAPEVLRAAHFVTRAPGGGGCVRELLRLILVAQGKWEEVVATHRGGVRLFVS